MSKTVLVILIGAALLFSAPAFAIDGQVLINQATVMAAGGFPYKITQPGSYKLSGNLVVSATSTDGIDINVSNVALDLNGFTISGPVTCTGQGASISCTGTEGAGIIAPGPSAVSVRNGSVVGFARGVETFFAQVEEIHAIGNAQIGIFAIDGVVSRNIASLNGQIGIYAIDSTVTENNATSNGEFGLDIAGGTYALNTLSQNGFAPVTGSGVSQNNNSCNGSPC
jgi:hypothetical protein